MQWSSSAGTREDAVPACTFSASRTHSLVFIISFGSSYYGIIVFKILSAVWIYILFCDLFSSLYISLAISSSILLSLSAGLSLLLYVIMLRLFYASDKTTIILNLLQQLNCIFEHARVLKQSTEHANTLARVFPHFLGRFPYPIYSMATPLSKRVAYLYTYRCIRTISTSVP